MARNDVAGRARVYADEYMLTNYRGGVAGKPTQLHSVASGDLLYESLDVDDVRVRLYNQTAVVTGRKTQRDLLSRCGDRRRSISLLSCRRADDADGVLELLQQKRP